MQRNSRFLVLGNGPSLKKEFFDCLGGIPCLGMNAAYRYWHLISWYPEVYCCLDDQVVVSHAVAIRELVERQHCRVFFLHHQILAHYPGLRALPNIYFLPQLCPGANNKETCERLDIDYQPSTWFKSHEPSKLTTGAYSVRFAAHLGYRDIGLLGIDCRYVQIVEGARLVNDIVLQIESTPLKNENYFFDDYQLAGDRYNVPSPAVHGGNLHLQAFQALAEDIKKFSWDLNIKLCTTESEIYDHGVFPYVPLHDFIAQRSLSAIFIPFTKSDLERLVLNLYRWGEQQFAPFLEAPEVPAVELHFAMNAAVDHSAEAYICDAYRKARLDRFFKGTFFHYSDLTGLDDLYTRVFEGDVGPAGYMAGPNNQFFDIVQKFSRGMSHIVLLEPDAVPIRANWLRVVEEIVHHSERFWICGSQYRGRATIKSLNHINGNAIYNVGDPAFRTFFEEGFLPYFYHRVKSHPHICYDIVMYDMFALAHSESASVEVISLWKRTAHFFRLSEWIVDVSHAEDHEPNALMTTEAARKRYPDSYLLHGAVENLFNCTDSSSIPTSGIPALAASYRHYSKPSENIRELIVLDPDALNNFGHYLSYDDKIKVTCVNKQLACAVFGNVRCDKEVSKHRPFISRVFSEHSWTVGRAKAPRSPSAMTFCAELRHALEQRRQQMGNMSSRLYMYCGSLPHAAIVDEILGDFPDISACINLFWTTFENYENRQFVALWAPVFKQILSNPRLIVTVPTQRLSTNLKRIFDVSISVAPHPSATFSSEAALRLLSRPGQTKTGSSGPTVILFPGGMREEKGFDDTIVAVRRITEQSDQRVSCVVRVLQTRHTPKAMVKLKKELATVVGCQLRGDDMNDDEFGQFLASGDIVVLPYRAPDFLERTSGLLIDAMVLAKPVVVYDGTWLADVVRQYGNGMVVKHRDVAALCDAVFLVRANLEAFNQRARSAGLKYWETNGWDNLLDAVLAPIRAISGAERLGQERIGVSFDRKARASVDEAKVVAHLLKRSSGRLPVMIDVGAHCGGSARHFVDKGWQIYCFEPDPTNRDHLIAQFGSEPNVTIDQRAVGEKAETGKAFFTSTESTGISGLYAFRDTHRQTAFVDVTTVAEIVKQHKLDRIDFLKIDVEGFDFAVLRGVPWDRIKPAVIQCEFEDAKTIPLGHTYKDVASFLVGKGYVVYISEWHPIVRYGIQHDWCCLAKYPEPLRTPHAWGNLLAFLEDPGSDVISEALDACVKFRTPQVGYDGPQRETTSVASGSRNERALVGAARGLNAMALGSTWSNLRHGIARRYIRLAERVKGRSPVLFRIGQFTVWSLRSASHHPRVVFAALFVIAAIATAPIYRPFWVYRVAFWIAAGVLGLVGMAAAAAGAVEEALRRLLERQSVDLDWRMRMLEVGIAKKTAAVVENPLKDVKSRLDAVSDRLDAVSNQSGALSARVEQDTAYQRFNRVLTPLHVQTLRNEWSKRLELKLTGPSLAYVAHKIRNIETNALGRLATSIEDAVLRTLVSTAVKGDTLEVLEIGTLFGIGLGMIYETNRGRYKNIHLTAIDPLSGYYGKDQPDVLLNVPVNESVFWHNMSKAGVPRDDVTLIESLSGSDEAIQGAGERTYDLLIIDGDHSYAGVKADFENYVGFVVQGGFIVFDDYGAAEWPDIQRFVDNEVRPESRVEFVGSEWRTAVYRVVGTARTQ